MLRTFIALWATAIAATLLPWAASGASPQLRSASADALDATTQVTIKIRNCEGCQVGTTSSTDNPADQAWNGPSGKISDGALTLTVPTARTRGLTISVTGPWEKGAKKRKSYVTLVAVAYQGRSVGEKVSFADARRAKRGAACWAGTSTAATTIRINARKVIDSDGAVSTIAWLPRTGEALAPYDRVFGGILGSQAVIPCAVG